MVYISTSCLLPEVAVFVIEAFLTVAVQDHSG